MYYILPERIYIREEHKQYEKMAFEIKSKALELENNKEIVLCVLRCHEIEYFDQ